MLTVRKGLERVQLGKYQAVLNQYIRSIWVDEEFQQIQESQNAILLSPNLNQSQKSEIPEGVLQLGKNKPTRQFIQRPYRIP